MHYLLRHICSHIHNYTTLARQHKLQHEIFLNDKAFTGEGGIKYLYHGLSICTGDNPLAKACELYPHIGRHNYILW